jgi:hypothetical protein
VPDKKTEIQKLAEYAGKFFERNKRGDGDEEFYSLKDRYPDWLYKLVHKAHDDGEWMPDDYKYLYVVEALDHLSEGMDPEEPEINADVYTSDLMKWFSSNGRRIQVVDEAMEELGREFDKERGIEGAIAQGQWYEKESIFRMVAEALQARLEEIEAGVSEVFRKRRSGDPEGVLDWEPIE